MYRVLLIFSVLLMLIPLYQAFAEEIKVTIPFGAYSPLCLKTDSCYVPSHVKINTGEVVVWFNADYSLHTVTSGTQWSGHDKLFHSEILDHNDKFEFAFNDFNAGTYPYYCLMHPWMTGSVTIEDMDGFQEREIS